MTAKGRGGRVGERKRGAGLVNWGTAGIHFIRSLFVIYFVHNLVDYNGTTRPICCCCCCYVTYVLTEYTPCEYICTCTYVIHSVIHAIALQGCGNTKMHNCKLDKEK